MILIRKSPKFYCVVTRESLCSESNGPPLDLPFRQNDVSSTPADILWATIYSLLLVVYTGELTNIVFTIQWCDVCMFWKWDTWLLWYPMKDNFALEGQASVGLTAMSPMKSLPEFWQLTVLCMSAVSIAWRACTSENRCWLASVYITSINQLILDNISWTNMCVLLLCCAVCLCP